MKKITLLKALEIITPKDKDMIIDIKDCIEDKLFDIEFQEPISDGAAYDRWNDKYDSLNNILYELNILVDNLDNITEEELDFVKDLVEDYQDEYRGLKSLYIFID